MSEHEIIQDLFEAYLSGEANKETKKKVEDHLTECDQCQQAFEQAQTAEEALRSLEEVERPTNGKRYVTRLRRVLYFVGAGILAFLVIALTIVEYVAFTDILGLQVPRLNFGLAKDAIGGVGILAIAGYFTSFWLQQKQRGAPWVWTSLRVVSLLFIGLLAIQVISVTLIEGSILVGLLMLALYIYLLEWRAKLPHGSNRVEFLHSLETAIPLFVLGIGLGGVKGLPSIIFLSLFLVAALIITVVRLPKLRYMALATTLVMVTTFGIAAGQTLYVLLNTLDVFPVLPSALGHPPVNADIKEFVSYQNNELGLSLESINTINEVNGIQISEANQAQQGQYLVQRDEWRNAMVSRITVIEFDNVGAARTFIDAWNPCHYGYGCDHVVDSDMEDTLLLEGRFLRIYKNATALAHNAWQTMRWVTIIETEGIFIDAMPLNKEIREMIQNRYRSVAENESGVLPVKTPKIILIEPTIIP
jgi:predicted anti-sigma-YlaC factor YlaD